MYIRRVQLIFVFGIMLVLNIFVSTWLLSGNAFGVAFASRSNQDVEAAAVTAIPTAFSYQGTLRDASGNLIDGTVNLSLRLYGAVTGGTALYTEDFANVNVRSGLFTVIVGDAKVLPASVFNTFPLYLGIKVNNDAELLPRQRLHPVPYAMQASSAQTAVTANNLAQGGGVPNLVTLGANGASEIAFGAGGKVTSDATGLSLTASPHQTVTVDSDLVVKGSWNAGAILDVGDSNGGPNTRSSYPVDLRRYVVKAPDNGSSPDTVSVDPVILNDFCRDEDGCWLSLYMRNFDGQDVMAGVTGFHLSLGPVNNNKQYWDIRDSASNFSVGVDNDGVVSHLMNVYNACFLTDGEYVNAASSDSKPGLGLLNWYGAWDGNMTCVLIIED
ncbi:MAG: hypothetical protein KDE46_16375 [Caldilineaceae bacterium]|nr:hypothetical protein [Caldilineaceae bacterium]MCB9151014.1 hypothetical protein [Caldilineaceae bacterium]